MKNYYEPKNWHEAANLFPMFSVEDAANLSDIPNVIQRATGLETGLPESRRRNYYKSRIAQP